MSVDELTHYCCWVGDCTHREKRRDQSNVGELHLEESKGEAVV